MRARDEGERNGQSDFVFVWICVGVDVCVCVCSSALLRDSLFRSFFMRFLHFQRFLRTTRVHFPLLSRMVSEVASFFSALHFSSANASHARQLEPLCARPYNVRSGAQYSSKP